VLAHGRQIIPDMGVVRSREPFKFLEGTNDISGTAEARVVKFYTQVGYIKSEL